jgi:inorganic pyrophosphatase
MNQPFTAHPWHGILPGGPEVFTCYIEMVPTDVVKYELDKDSGLLRVDRPQKFSSVPPTLYGFIPRTYCAERVAARCEERLSRKGIVGDGDPLDVCVLTEKPITHGNLLVPAVPIGGLRMLDGNEADDKIIAVLKNDNVYGAYKDVLDAPRALIDRLRHYFLTYKQAPDMTSPATEIPEVYGREEAFEVIRRSLEDYRIKFP